MQDIVLFRFSENFTNGEALALDKSFVLSVSIPNGEMLLNLR